jgi:prolyl 4-hydroxylase
MGDEGPVFYANLGPWASYGSSSFPGQIFIFAKPGEPVEPICILDIKPGASVYYCNPFIRNDPNDPAHAELRVRRRSLKYLFPEDREQYEAHVTNLDFAERYRNFTGGSEWLTMYPRNPPKHKMWRADYYGQEHHVTTSETQFFALPEQEQVDSAFNSLSIQEMRDSNRLAAYRAPGVLNMTIKALSCAPRAFEIRNFLSEVEVDHILDVVGQRQLERSTTGSGGLSETRTSRTTWIPRNTDPVLNAVFRRVADALRMDEALLRDRLEGERFDYPFSQSINEDLQIVHYNEGQEYMAHHDFGFPTGRPDSPSRSINLCLYLNDVPKGGTTSFPRWRNAETSDAIHVKPEKTKAIIFYMINPDGNLDDLTQHAAMPVLEGEKWFANLWIHDPYK